MGATIQEVLSRSASAHFGKRRYPEHVYRAAWLMEHCGTEVLGDHAVVCERGHVVGYYYNSCRHRSCPRCSYRETERWLAGVRERLLPCAHHHVIFTLPHDLLPFWRWNRSGLADLLFRVAWDVVRTLLGEDRYLGGRSGMIASFQSWSETLAEHPHLHCIVPRVGWDVAKGMVEARKSILLPARAVKSLFRGKFLGELERSLRRGELEIPPHLEGRGWRQLLRYAARRKWNVRIQPAYQHADGVATYLARYLRGGPVKNHRLALSGDRIVMWGRGGDAASTVTFSADEFLRRLFSHIPEPGFRAVRSYGIYHHHHREILKQLQTELLGLTIGARSARLPPPEKGLEARCCPQCGSPLRVIWPRRGRPPPAVELRLAS